MDREWFVYGLGMALESKFIVTTYKEISVGFLGGNNYCATLSSYDEGATMDCPAESYSVGLVYALKARLVTDQTMVFDACMHLEIPVYHVVSEGFIGLPIIRDLVMNHPRQKKLNNYTNAEHVLYELFCLTVQTSPHYIYEFLVIKIAQSLGYVDSTIGRDGGTASAKKRNRRGQPLSSSAPTTIRSFPVSRRTRPLLSRLVRILFPRIAIETSDTTVSPSSSSPRLEFRRESYDLYRCTVVGLTRCNTDILLSTYNIFLHHYGLGKYAVKTNYVKKRVVVVADRGDKDVSRSSDEVFHLMFVGKRHEREETTTTTTTTNARPRAPTYAECLKIYDIRSINSVDGRGVLHNNNNVIHMSASTHMDIGKKNAIRCKTLVKGIIIKTKGSSCSYYKTIHEDECLPTDIKLNFNLYGTDEQIRMIILQFSIYYGRHIHADPTTELKISFTCMTERVAQSGITNVHSYRHRMLRTLDHVIKVPNFPAIKRGVPGKTVLIHRETCLLRCRSHVDYMSISRDICKEIDDNSEQPIPEIRRTLFEMETNKMELTHIPFIGALKLCVLTRRDPTPFLSGLMISRYVIAQNYGFCMTGSMINIRFRLPLFFSSIKNADSTPPIKTRTNFYDAISEEFPDTGIMSSIKKKRVKKTTIFQMRGSWNLLSVLLDASDRGFYSKFAWNMLSSLELHVDPNRHPDTHKMIEMMKADYVNHLCEEEEEK